MSGYFSGFSFNKITDSISNAAHKTQDTLNNAIANVSDPHTKLSLKARTRYLQESFGTVGEISKLPPQYQSLERKVDALEKCLKRMLLVTRTFEIEGYDYPPNLTESISDWWSLNKDGWFSSSSKKSQKTKVDASDAFLPHSFAHAISKAAHDCNVVFKDLQEEEEGEEEDEDVVNITEMFDSWSKCYKNIDLGKSEMDSIIVKEFNNKIEKLINQDFKRAHDLRKKVENSRLKFDTVRYEMKLKEEKVGLSTKTKDSSGAETDLKTDDAATAKINIEEAAAEDKSEKAAGDNAANETGDAAPEAEATLDTEHAANIEDAKLLEELEDEFVSNTTAAVEAMGEISECSEILSLAKLFQNFQLVYYRQCVQEIEASLKTLSGLEGENS
ncbi:hypothetical protein HG536_0D05340 [Torulaspora globosa]|uniref:BAR domain-containing protein n=1 Tax=Torulaspora globosa TaxID=48254 RepID=A0A7G3ZHM6_9SACH|nr:uncharacterized protein HG536_0D05340 [Torulaspora globosa]QLL33012.1 hypothetical protein HG536_0D05340 [Torulaspora globosa]